MHHRYELHGAYSDPRPPPFWPSVLAAALLVLPAALLAGLLPSLLAARLVPQDVLRDDA